MELNEIQTVKISGDGYLLNGTMSVPKADGNRHYELIKQWIAEGNTPEPEFTDEELLVQSQAEFRTLRDSYLVKCDIAINIALDNGVDATELRALRQALRDATIKWIMPDVAIIN